MKGRITKGSEEAPHVPEKRERGGRQEGSEAQGNYQFPAKSKKYQIPL
jgi:hypothetical protein